MTLTDGEWVKLKAMENQRMINDLRRRIEKLEEKDKNKAKTYKMSRKGNERKSL